jgi:GNAT superfamily N-acetyltransferase
MSGHDAGRRFVMSAAETNLFYPARIAPKETGLSRGDVARRVTIRRATDGDRPRLLELLDDYFSRGVDVEAHYRWLYTMNPHGRAFTWIALAAKTNAAVGMMSIFPRRLLVHGEQRLAAIGGDGYVRPEMRRQGIASALHRATLREMHDLGIELMYGPPEPHNLSALRKAGAAIACDLRRYVRPLEPGALGGIAAPLLRRLAPPRSVLALDPIRGVDPRVSVVWENAAPDFIVTPVRDPRHCAWRYEGCPGQTQRAYVVRDGSRPVGLVAVALRDRRVQLVDLLAARRWQDAVVDAVLYAYRDHAAVEIRLNERGPVVPTLLRKAFVGREKKAFQILMPGGHPHAATLLSARSWYYTTGDGDV